MNKIHIVNGDNTAEILSKTSIEGEVIVWREMLCEGTLHQDVGSDKFWMGRYDFFENEAGVSRLEYFDKTIREIQKIDAISQNSEIVLWFEYDLFCQINLLALCTYLLKFYRKDIKYSLVCVGHEKGKESLQSLSDYSIQEYENLLNNKINISRNNLVFAARCWELYVENNRQKLIEFDFKKSSKFIYLQAAMDQHIKRFSNGNSLNQIDNMILNIINNGSFTKNGIVRELLLWQQLETVYGFGDLQYFMALDKLRKYYKIDNGIFVLNDEGKVKLI